MNIIMSDACIGIFRKEKKKYCYRIYRWCTTAATVAAVAHTKTLAPSKTCDDDDDDVVQTTPQIPRVSYGICTI